MSACRKTCALLAVLPLLLPTAARALIIFDTATSVDNTKNVIDPLNAATFPSGSSTGAPWQHVMQYGANNASAIYLGNGFLLTARHVGAENTGLVISGTTYDRDTSFAPVPIVIPGSPNTLVDLQVQKILGDPGLPVLPLALPAAADTNAQSTLVGWGKGKGALLADQGWNWGDDASRAFRWGTNITNAAASTVSYQVGSESMSFRSLTTDFNSTGGPSEAAATLGDSGSALFQQLSGTWTLSGVTVTVTTDGSSRYDTLPLVLGDQFPDITYFVRLRDYSWVLRFDAWKAKYSIAAATPDENDNDADGIPLLLEYALGLDPTKTSRNGLPTASIEGDKLALTYSRLASVTDIKLEVETRESLDTGSWAVETTTISVLRNTTVVQTVKATVPLGSGNYKFARLKVTRL